MAEEVALMDDLTDAEAAELQVYGTPGWENYYEEAITRHACLKSLHEFVKELWDTVEQQPFVDGEHIRLICTHLEAVYRGKIKRLCINVPPGCSKSLIVSVFWTAWVWAKDPTRRIFCASYDQMLSTRDSVRCKAVINSEKFSRLFGHGFSLGRGEDQKTYFKTDKGGWRMATSVGGHGTGEHPDFVVIDDPHNVMQAESEVERQGVIDWCDLTMSTRGVVRDVRWVVIMQRLNDRDFTAHVLNKGGWVHLMLPMRFELDRKCVTQWGGDWRIEDGELLIPQLFPEYVVKDLEANLGPYGVAGQLQQRPSPRGGGMFKEEFFSRRVKAAPYDCIRIRATDRAATSEGGCYSASVLLAKSKENPPKYYVEHVFRGQWEPRERNLKIQAAAMRDRAKYGQYEPIHYIEAERGSTGLESFQNITAMLAGFRVKEDQPTGSKDTRAEPWSDALAAGNVYLVDDGTWPIDDFVREHCAFKPEPGKRLGKYKDQVDAASMAYNLLAGRKTTSGVQFLSYGLKKGTTRFVVCDDTSLISTVIDNHHTLLVSVQDAAPLSSGELPGHALIKLLDSLVLQYADVQPEHHQATWQDDLTAYGKRPEEVMFTREHGKRLWQFLLKKRQILPTVIVFHGNTVDRVMPVVLAVCDAMGYRKEESIYVVGVPDVKLVPNNPYVYQTVRSCRNLVV